MSGKKNEFTGLITELLAVMVFSGVILAVVSGIMR